MKKKKKNQKTRLSKEQKTSTTPSKNVPLPLPETPVKKSKPSNIYFTQETEDAIVLYNTSKSEIERNIIFSTLLQKPFRKLAENIINTFKFTYFEDSMENVQQDVVSFMVEKIGQYDQSKGKAFSYFSIVAKHYLIQNNNANYKKLKSRETMDVVDFSRNFHSEIRAVERNDENTEFIRMMVEFWDNNIGVFFKKEKDRDIANAVLELFRQVDTLEQFNKKHLYVLIREQTDCNTQQITRVVNMMKKYYADMTKQYHEAGSIETDNVHANRFF